MEIETKMLKAVSLYMAQDDVRYYLNGILAEIRNKELRLVAANGEHIICWRVGGIDSADTDVIMPGVFVDQLIKTKDKFLSIEIGPELKCEKMGLFNKAVNGKYPDWRRVIRPSNPPAPAVFAPKLLMTLERAASFAGSKYNWTLEPRGCEAAPFTIGSSLAGVIMPLRPAEFNKNIFDSVIKLDL